MYSFPVYTPHPPYLKNDHKQKKGNKFLEYSKKFAEVIDTTRFVITGN